MAETGAELDTGDQLEQKILQVLSHAGVPLRIAQLVKECSVPKKQLNRVLYRLNKEAKVSLEGPATWRLGGSAPGDVVPVDPTTQPSQDERICWFLETNGPCRALRIAKALGMKTATEVNPDLYFLRNRHLLNFDGEKWMTYRPEHAGRCRSATAPTIMIYQTGANSHVSIANSKATQIGHGNVLLSPTASVETGPRVPLLPPTVPADPSTQAILVGACGPQDIHVEQSMLKHVQLGHSNEMSILTAPEEEATYSFTNSPPVSDTAASSGSSFEVRMPQPDSNPERSAAQRVHIQKCFVEDTTIGNSNRMTINLGSKGPGGVTGSRKEGRGEPGEPEKENTDPSSEATHSGTSGTHSSPSSNSMHQLSPKMRAVTLGDSNLHTTEPRLCMDRVPEAGNWQP